MTSDLNVPKPSHSEVQKYLDKWQTLDNYPKQESALNKLFFEFAPGNTDMNDILLKCATLNDFYSTRIRTIDLVYVADNIAKIDNLDELLEKGDTTLIDKMQIFKDKEGLKRRCYSFATKYCSHHNPIALPIYDSFVDEMLWHFQKTYQFSNFHRKDLKNYQRFIETLLDFKRYFDLNDVGFKELDRYLWQLGKDTFGNKKE